MSSGQPWSDPDKAELSRLWLLGKPVREITEALGRNKNSIIGMAHRLGMPLHSKSTHTESRPDGRKNKGVRVRAKPEPKPERAVVYLPPIQQKGFNK